MESKALVQLVKWHKKLLCVEVCKIQQKKKIELMVVSNSKIKVNWEIACKTRRIDFKGKGV